MATGGVVNVIGKGLVGFLVVGFIVFLLFYSRRYFGEFLLCEGELGHQGVGVFLVLLLDLL